MTSLLGRLSRMTSFIQPLELRPSAMARPGIERFYSEFQVKYSLVVRPYPASNPTPSGTEAKLSTAVAPPPIISDAIYHNDTSLRFRDAPTRT
ncbi:hypothetical protein EVAR_26790_1 [Eumeta japonica]|uniref:Uncharacterized protein n=1 Tax=Eumeta variegata TaxID=151549 RepID=A0A4C1WF12_EUMVA|nr:hypothetical protein EVAR_26790_1 [Eumeta japonica]